MIYKNTSRVIIFFSILFAIINFYISYTFSGRSIPYVVGNVFGLTLIAIAISSIFPQYRNSRSRWLILLNTMIITFFILVSNIFIRTAEDIGYQHLNENNTTEIKSTNYYSPIK